MSTRNQPAPLLLVLAFIAFISLGLPDGLLGVAWPTLRQSFGVPLDALGQLMAVMISGYLLSSFTSGLLIARIGLGWLLAASCALTGGALLGYTVVPTWGLLLTLAVAAGLGAGAIDAGLNGYVAERFSDRTMQWLHASFGVGITLGPLIMTASLRQWETWRGGYIVVGIAQLLLALAFATRLSVWQVDTSQRGEKIAPDAAPWRGTLRQPRVWLSAFLFFLYTGAELGLGLWLYTLLTDARAVAPTVAGLVTGSYWAMFTVGRIIAGVAATRIANQRLVNGGLLLATVGALLLVRPGPPIAAVVAVALVGLAIAPIYPALVSGTAQRVGAAFTTNSIGIQVAAAGLGGALLPGLLGLLATRSTLNAIPVALALLFVIMLALHHVARHSPAR
ncbi:MAG: MFS transporter [Anaerolineales bacterium]|nr:MFS transporter [Anaerolineales bacterium]MCB9127271.1 MFS transporter [Ardenticatenales bacterium]